MARRFTIQLIMDLASKIGANPAKAVSRSNISFLGKGPTKNPLFQNRLAGLENATEANLGKPETLFAAIDDAVGWAKDGKLNSIQTEILGHNLSGINKILNPPPLPMATVSRFPKQETGIASLETGGVKGATSIGPVKGRSYSYIDEQGNTRIMPSKEWSEGAKKAIKEGYTDARGRTWDLGAQETGPEVFNKALNQKTGMSRAIARQLLLQDTRLKLKPEELFMLKEGKGEPLDLMRKYYGRSMFNLDEFLNSVNLQAGNPRDLATRVLAEVELIPQFASGGLARILEI
jgi:hypothetical protein